MKNTYILYFLALYFFLNSQCICWKSGLNGAQYKSVKWRVGVESARLHGIVNGESLWNVFCCLLCIFYCQTTPILKTLVQFENLVFVIMSTRENIRLIARSSLLTWLHKCRHLIFLMINLFCNFTLIMDELYSKRTKMFYTCIGINKSFVSSAVLFFN